MRKLAEEGEPVAGREGETKRAEKQCREGQRLAKRDRVRQRR